MSPAINIKFTEWTFIFFSIRIEGKKKQACTAKKITQTIHNVLHCSGVSYEVEHFRTNCEPINTVV